MYVWHFLEGWHESFFVTAVPVYGSFCRLWGLLTVHVLLMIGKLEYHIDLPTCLALLRCEFNCSKISPATVWNFISTVLEAFTSLFICHCFINSKLSPIWFCQKHLYKAYSGHGKSSIMYYAIRRQWLLSLNIGFGFQPI